MKMNVKSFVCGVLVGAFGLTTVFATPITKQITAIYSINGVVVDGVNIQFDEDSQPFTVDGRTYLPVRAISEAFDKNVDFDNKTSTVIISSKTDSNVVTTPEINDAYVYLTKDMVTGSPKGLTIWGVREWDTAMKDNAGRTHATGIRFATSLYDADKKDGANVDVYPTETRIDIGLIGDFSRLEGQLVLTENSMRLYNEYNITIFADDIEIKKIENIKTGSVPEMLDFDVSKVKKLTFHFESTTSNIIMESVEFGIVDTKLYQ